MKKSEMLHQVRSTLRRINGLSLWGAQWQNSPDPRAEVDKIFTEFSSRRVLFQSYANEVPHETVKSVLEIRRYLVDTMKNVRHGTDTYKLLKNMTNACLEYLDNRKIETDHVEMERALSRLRLIFGACLLALSENHGLNLSGRIEAILPNGIDAQELKDAMT